MFLDASDVPLHMYPQAGNLLSMCNFMFTELSAWSCEGWGYKTDLDVSKEVFDYHYFIHYFIAWLKQFEYARLFGDFLVRDGACVQVAYKANCPKGCDADQGFQSCGSLVMRVRNGVQNF